MTGRRTWAIGVAAVVSVAWFGTPATAQPAPEERVAAIKQSLQESMAALRQYEWVETTIVSLKGEEKSRAQKRCYYGADGKIQKIALTEPQPAEQVACPMFCTSGNESLHHG